MNAIKTLRDDHKTLRGLFAQIDVVDARASEMKQGVIRQLLMEVELHSRIEEELFYPALDKTTDSQLQGLLVSCRDAHKEADELVSKLSENSPDEEIRSLVTALEEHMVEEEEELFPLAEQLLGSELDALGEKIVARRRELASDPRFQDAHPSKTQNPNGGEQARKIA